MRISSPMMMRPTPMKAVRFASTPDMTPALQAFLDTHLPKLEQPYDFLQIGNLKDLPTGFTNAMDHTLPLRPNPRPLIEAQHKGQCKGEMALPEVKDGYFLIFKNPKNDHWAKLGITDLEILGVNNFFRVVADRGYVKKSLNTPETFGLRPIPIIRECAGIAHGDRFFYNLTQLDDVHKIDQNPEAHRVVLNIMPD